MAITGRGKARLGGRRAVGLLAAGTAVALALAAGGAVSQAGAATQDTATQDTVAQDAATQATATEAKKPKPTHSQIQLLAINDFHGNLEPATGSGGNINGIPAGGAAYLATHLKDLRAAAKAKGQGSVTVAAGDLIGASPLLSAAFHDEPTIEAFNLMGLDYAGVGNHEFDEGIPELLRMQNGGCHPVDGCQDGDGFAGASFGYLAANVTYKDTGETIFPPYAIRQFPGVKVAIVGMTLEGTPSVVTQSAIEPVNFGDEADTVNALVPQLKKQGIETIIVLLHEGGSGGALNETTVNQCNNPTGAIVDVVQRMDREIDLVVSGHTNWGINCPNFAGTGIMLTGAASAGRVVTDVNLTLSRASKDVVGAAINNVIVRRDEAMKALSPDITDLIAKYGTLVAPTENRVIGEASATLTRTAAPNGESVLGDIIADAQLWATSGAGFPSTPAVVSFMNPGGIRADINAGPITYGEAFTVQPFGNILVTMDMKGSDIDAVLEQQTAGTTLQIPASLTYDRSAGAPAGSRMSNIRIDGVLIDPNATYRVTLNNFLADGGDGFTVFRNGTNRFFGEFDLDAFVRYLETHNPTSPTLRNRINLVP